MNWQSYSYRDSRVYVPKGTGVYKSRVDVYYYDPEWMNIIPVVEAQPMFLEQYSFVPTEGSFGYLKKEIVPGYLLCVERKQRPLLNVATQPVEVRAKCGYIDARDGKMCGVWREWCWSPSTGWQYIEETISPYTSGLKNDTTVWELSFKYSHTVSGSNPANFPASWTNRWGGDAPSLYWTSAKTLKVKVEGMADLKEYYNNKKVTYIPAVDYVSVDPVITLPGVPSLAPGESKWIVSSDKTAAVRFWKTPIRSRYTCESWDVFQNRVLNEINTNIILPLLSSQEEAAFNNGGRFVMTPTFTAGQGGVAAGAQKKLIYRDLIWSSKWEYYRFGDYLRETTIGFPYAGITLRSYVTNYSPTDGLVVKGRDEYLGDILRIRNEIPFSKYEPSGQQHWRSYDPHTDSVSPPPYSEDR